MLCLRRLVASKRRDVELFHKIIRGRDFDSFASNHLRSNQSRYPPGLEPVARDSRVDLKCHKNFVTGKIQLQNQVKMLGQKESKVLSEDDIFHVPMELL